MLKCKTDSAFGVELNSILTERKASNQFAQSTDSEMPQLTGENASKLLSKLTGENASIQSAQSTPLFDQILDEEITGTEALLKCKTQGGLGELILRPGVGWRADRSLSVLVFHTAS